MIRLANNKDLPAITKIYNQAVVSRLATCDEDEKSLEDREKWYLQFNFKYPLFVCEVDNSIAAYGAIFPVSPKSGFRFTVEHSVYVGDDFQGKGIGRKMLLHLIEEARARGYTYLEARIFKHNQVSMKLHESVGFNLVGTQHKVANLDGQWFDICICALHL